MAIIDCPACSQYVSEDAQNCPHCGHPISQTTKTVQSSIPNPSIKIVGSIGFVLLLLGDMVFLYHAMNIATQSPLSTSLIIIGLLFIASTILYFFGCLKVKRNIFLYSSIALIVSSILSGIALKCGNEYLNNLEAGILFDVSDIPRLEAQRLSEAGFIVWLFLCLANIIFAIIGIFMTKSKKQKSKTPFKDNNLL